LETGTGSAGRSGLGLLATSTLVRTSRALAAGHICSVNLGCDNVLERGGNEECLMSFAAIWSPLRSCVHFPSHHLAGARCLPKLQTAVPPTLPCCWAGTNITNGEEVAIKLESTQVRYIAFRLSHERPDLVFAHSSPAHLRRKRWRYQHGLNLGNPPNAQQMSREGVALPERMLATAGAVTEVVRDCASFCVQNVHEKT
jgi:hypothetical protein